MTLGKGVTNTAQTFTATIMGASTADHLTASPMQLAIANSNAPSTTQNNVGISFLSAGRGRDLIEYWKIMTKKAVTDPTGNTQRSDLYFIGKDNAGYPYANIIYASIIPAGNGYFNVGYMATTAPDSGLNVGASNGMNGLHVYGGGRFHGSVGVRTTAPRMALDVTGVARATDTIRSGDFTTYTYFIPGGAIVQSSSKEIKKNIIDVPAFSFDNILAVNPKRYQFKESALHRGIDTTGDFRLTASEKNTLHFKKEADETERVNKASAIVHTGFLAEDFATFGGNGKEINTGEVMAVLWKTNQALIQKVKELEARIEKLEKK